MFHKRLEKPLLLTDEIIVVAPDVHQFVVTERNIVDITAENFLVVDE